MHLFYATGISGRIHVLDEQESKHCVKVLRLHAGDKIILVNGIGGRYLSEIVDDNPRACQLRILSSEENYKPLPYYLHIGIAPTKNIDRLEWFLEKTTEIGISEITPLLCEHSERKILNYSRLEKILVAAMKQSEKAYKPILNPLTGFQDWIKMKQSGTRLIGYCGNQEPVPFWKLSPGKHIIIAIGPEGDFSDYEIEQAELHQFIPFSLGDSRLRTETAGVVSCAFTQIQFYNGLI